MAFPNNRITKVAVVGASGRIGGAFVEALLETKQHTVTALRHPTSKGELPHGVHSVAVDYDDEASLIKALEGQHFLVITLSVSAPPDTHSKLTSAAAKAGVPYVMPNIYGGLPEAGTKFAEESIYTPQLVQRRQELEQLGVKYIAMCCGFWYEWSLALPEQWYGFTIKERKVTFFDDGEAKISTSTWDQCGRALASLLSLPVERTGVDEHAKAVVSDWDNKGMYISSFDTKGVSQRDMLNSLHRVLGTSDKDWEIRTENSTKRYQDALVEMKSGQMTGFAKALYTRVFYPSDKDKKIADGWYEDKIQNELLGLPNESLDEASQRAVSMIGSGWNPFAGSVRS